MKRVAGVLSLTLALGSSATPTEAEPPASQPSAEPVYSSAVDVGSGEGAPKGSHAPTSEEWDKVNRLTTKDGRLVGSPVSCNTYVLRGWVRLSCTKLTILSDVAQAIGAVWGVAGNLDEVKAETSPVGAAAVATLMKEGVPTVRSMASSVEITFPVRPGSALILEVSGARWVYEEYNGNFFTSIDPGFLVDVSWALGEKEPTLIFDPATN